MSAAAIMNVQDNLQQTRRRGRRRRRTPEAPCADCIQRASLSHSRGDVRFCNDCARTLGRRAAPEAPRFQHINQRQRSNAARPDYGRRAAANRVAAALRNAQSVSPIASRHGEFAWVSLDEAAAVLAEAPYSSVSAPDVVTFAPTATNIVSFAPNGSPTAIDIASFQDESLLPIANPTPFSNEGILPITTDLTPFTIAEAQTLSELQDPPVVARHRTSKSPEIRRSDVRGVRERLVDLPRAFDSLDGAYDVLHPVHDRLAALIMNIESSTDTLVTSFTQDNYRVRAIVWLSLWEEAFARYLSATIRSMTVDQRKAAMTLKSHHLVAECFAVVQPAETALDWGGSSTKFQAILDLADYVMRGVTVQHQTTTHHQRGNRNNSIDSFQTTLPHLTILDPVYEVQIRTTDVTLRDRAAQLLSMINPRHFSTEQQQFP